MIISNTLEKRVERNSSPFEYIRQRTDVLMMRICQAIKQPINTGEKVFSTVARIFLFVAVGLPTLGLVFLFSGPRQLFFLNQQNKQPDPKPQKQQGDGNAAISGTATTTGSIVTQDRERNDNGIITPSATAVSSASEIQVNKNANSNTAAFTPIATVSSMNSQKKNGPTFNPKKYVIDNANRHPATVRIADGMKIDVEYIDTAGDGNCWFNAQCLLLSGNEKGAAPLRKEHADIYKKTTLTVRS
jgi:hypothetical protein